MNATEQRNAIISRATCTGIPYANVIVYAALKTGWTWAEDEDESAQGLMCFFREKGGESGGDVESASIMHISGQEISFSRNGIPQEGWKLHRAEEYFA